MKKVMFYTLSLIVLTVSIFSDNAFGYYNGTTSYYEETKTTIGDFTYILKENVQYGSVKVPYSATVVDIPNIKMVEIPEKVTCDGIEFLVTDLDLCGSYIVTKKNKPETKYTNNNVQEIMLPDTIYNITAFEDFTNLLKINIPSHTAMGRSDNYKKIKYEDYNSAKPRTFDFHSSDYKSWFIGCPKIKLSVDPNNPYYSYKNDMLFSKDEKEIFMSFNCSTDVIIPHGVEKIYRLGGNGFKNAKNIKLPNTLIYLGASVFASSKITKINLPDNLKEIKEKAFRDSKLTKITLSKNIKKIRLCAFSNTNLKSIKFNNGLTLIGTSAFSNCKKLKSVTFPKKIKTINRLAFNGCKNLSKVTIKNAKKIPKIGKNALKNTKRGIKFVVKNKKVAKSLNKKLKGSGVRNAKILIGKKVVYKNING